MPITATRTCERANKPRQGRTGRPASPARPPAPRSGAAPDHQADQAIVCAACSAVITHCKHRVQVDDQHEHAFFNPAGIAFTIRCFRQAPGACPHGAPTSEFTWFPGCCWQIVLCASCQTHLGWLFTGSHSFFGLIATRLRETD